MLLRWCGGPVHDTDLCRDDAMVSRSIAAARACCDCRRVCDAMQVNIMVECAFVKDALKGDDAYELRLKFLAQAAETYPYRDED